MGFLDIFKKNTTEGNKTEYNNNLPCVTGGQDDIILRSEAMLAEVETDISLLNPIKLPIEQIALLGTGVASIMPSLRTITNTITMSGDKLFRWVNSENAAGTLKLNKKDHLLGGSFIDKSGKSVYAKFESVGSQTVTSATVMPIDPTTLMIAAALASIEKKLDNIIEMERQILTFLEEDKESEIEGDLKTLTNIVKEYKFNWDNSDYKSSHHKLVLDIKRTAEQNIIFYQKQVADKLKDDPFVHLQHFVDTKQNDLQKLFKYYQMSL